jgi:hypothetical protein
LLLTALGLPTALWWGYFLIEDALQPLVSYDAVLWLWWAPEVALMVAGALLIARGDRIVAPPTLFGPVADRVLRGDLRRVGYGRTCFTASSPPASCC